MLHLKKKFLLLVLSFSLVTGGMQASSNSTVGTKNVKECVRSSLAVGSAIGAVCGFLYANNCNFWLVFLGGHGLTSGIITALHHERDSDRKTKEIAQQVAFSSWCVSCAAVGVLCQEILKGA